MSTEHMLIFQAQRIQIVIKKQIKNLQMLELYKQTSSAFDIVCN